MILSAFDLQVTLMLPTKFQIKWPFSSGEQTKNTFSRWPCHGSHLGFPIGTRLANFDLQVIPMLPTNFKVSWPRGVGGAGF